MGILAVTPEVRYTKRTTRLREDHWFTRLTRDKSPFGALSCLSSCVMLLIAYNSLIHLGLLWCLVFLMVSGEIPETSLF